MSNNEDYKVCFIISNKYILGYPNFLKHYIDNVIEFYGNSLILVVDNNSNNINDLVLQFKSYDNVTIIQNTDICKFEIGAYKFGIKYLIEQNLIEKYDYYACTQDNYFLQNNFDFRLLDKNNVNGAVLFGNDIDWHSGPHPHQTIDDRNKELIRFGITDSQILNNNLFCWCSSFIINKHKIFNFYEIIKNIQITNRWGSILSEKYLGGILYFLNNGIHYAVDPHLDLPYNNRNVTLTNCNDIKSVYFVKCAQDKTETTPDPVRV
jgi:hypothetical protein